ncbi:MAG: Hpt domain-containing protein [Kofleriaceae bacterium]|nr:Hpt domain-containing protein [Kofleriaceae bacterium]
MTTDEPRARRLETFRSLAAERLGHVSLGWIELEQGALAPGRVETMMRELHTLKGEAGLMGLAAVAAALHLLEDLVGAAVRAATAPPPELGDLVLAGIDAMARR